MPSFSPFTRLVLLAALTAAVAGCATEQPRPRHGHGQGREHGEGGERGPSLFISPAGQPFRAGPDDPYPSAAWFAAADADHDGRLTRSEFREDAARFFRRIDLNGDSVIDGAEVTAYEHDMVPEILGGGGASAAPRSDGGWGGQGGQGGHRHGGRGGRMGGGGNSSGGGSQTPRAALQGAAPYTLNRQAEPVSAADADFDSKVTLAEFLAAADRHFDQLDGARAGFLTLAALPKTPVQRMARRSRAPDD